MLPRLPKGRICNYRYGELSAQADWKYLLNFCNRRTQCAPGVCLRRDKRGGEYCKNGAPFEHLPLAKFVRVKGMMEWAPQRNDPLLNSAPRREYRLWRDDVGCAPACDRDALLQYLTKCVAKCEQSTDALRDVMANPVARV